MSHSHRVSCIMPTYNRRPFIARAVQYFLRQDYPDKELIVVDDGSESVSDLLPADPRIRCIRLAQRTVLGAKRNMACEAATGDIIIHFDDDDWHAPQRIRRQIDALLAAQADVCGLNDFYFYNVCTGQASRFTWPAGNSWVAGGSLCYTRVFWQRNPFPMINVCEDSQFLATWIPKRIVALRDLGLYVAILHDRNINTRRAPVPHWPLCPVDEVRHVLHDDWPFYGAAHTPGAPPAPEPPLTAPGAAVASVSDDYAGAPGPVAREADLRLPEFQAFNQGLDLPRMRRWELPFVLGQARLHDTAAILDCTVNPAGLGARIASLYPFVQYRHWDPLPSGGFALPFGIPDEAFDRVFCVNTLEHLTRSQRRALVAELERKLKPGGLLIATSDYYFDSLFERVQLLLIGAVRPDRSEFTGGWNQIPATEWTSLFTVCGLEPILAPTDAPREDDPRLYRNSEPCPHATIGGVFRKPAGIGQRKRPRGRKVLLSLLTWNTREVSGEAARALIAEGRMLRRLGHEPVFCACDNGSTDGTAEVVQELTEGLDIESRSILNPTNRGSSVARNQIIDCALECGADYLLLLDGDVEIVPGSSFALLRHMESSGHRLGCVGPHYTCQTPERGRASRSLYSLQGLQLETGNDLAWTQYGLFRRDIFADGVRFDESGPFAQPGWGWEDNDLALQIEAKGYVNQHFFGVTYLHRAAQSSVRNLRQAGVDPGTRYEERKRYMLAKWEPHLPGQDPRLAMFRASHWRDCV